MIYKYCHWRKIRCKRKKLGREDEEMFMVTKGRAKFIRFESDVNQQLQEWKASLLAEAHDPRQQACKGGFIRNKLDYQSPAVQTVIIFMFPT